MKDEIFVDMWEKITTDNIWRGELKNKRKDGSYYWVYAPIYPIINYYSKKSHLSMYASK
jgi:PAS domain-containing protein